MHAHRLSPRCDELQVVQVLQGVYSMMQCSKAAAKQQQCRDVCSSSAETGAAAVQ